MKSALKPMALALLVATAQFAGVARAETGKLHAPTAAESWARKHYDNAGHELEAAVRGLENGARRVGAQAKAGASTTVADTRVLGEKLASGATWTRDEVARGFALLGKGIDTLGQKIDGSKKASPSSAGA